MSGYVSRVPLDEALGHLVDDAAVFPPGDVPFDAAVDAYDERSVTPVRELVRSFVLRDTDLPRLTDPVAPLSVVCTGGAGQLAGPTSYIRRRDVEPAGFEIAVRDLDDLAGNVRRIVTATDDLETEWPIFVELPATAPDHAWLTAADVVAEAGVMRLKFRTGGLDASAFPASDVLASWIDAALDRELPFKCTAGLHRAVRHTGDDGLERHGFLNVIVATGRAFDGASQDEVVSVLENRELAVTTEEIERGRRWFVSFGSCSVDEPWDDLVRLGFAS